MNTHIFKIENTNINKDKLDFAADILKKGGLVAFPTETVYGLGANALDSTAVQSIFRAKGRPSDNPLIVHISDKRHLSDIVDSIPPAADRLISEFWPGPLTLVFPRSRSVTDVVTAGLETVAVRMPSHPIALMLIEKAGVPVAAPSANMSGRPSPTAAEHVIEDLMGKVDVIIDGGPVSVGVESTVLDISTTIPAILRPGGITKEQLENVLGRVEVCGSLSATHESVCAPRSPGMKYRHYAPKAHITIYEGPLDSMVRAIDSAAGERNKGGRKTAILATDETKVLYKSYAVSMGSRRYPETIAARLFHLLRELDAHGFEEILAEAVETDGIGFAIMNRLTKAASFNIVRV